METRIQIKKCSILLIFLIIPFFRPDFISAMYGGSFLEKAFQLWRILAFVIIFGLYVVREPKRADIDLILLLLYQMILLCSGIFHGEEVSSRVVDIGNGLGILMLTKYYARHYPYEYVKVFFDYFFVVIVMNAVLTVLFPSGLNHAVTSNARVNFMGKDNMVSLTFLLSMVFSVFYRIINKDSIRPALLLIIILATELYYFSGSGIVAITLVVFYLVFLKGNMLANKLISPITVTAAFIFLEITCVFTYNAEMFSWVFQILKKDMTFSTRIYYWQTALYQLKGEMVFGTGSGIVHLWSGKYYSHNAIMDILLKGGAAGLLAWGMMVGIPFFRMKWEKSPVLKGILSVIMLAFLLIGLVEGLEDRMTFMAFYSIICVSEILEKSDLFSNSLCHKICVEKSDIKWSV